MEAVELVRERSELTGWAAPGPRSPPAGPGGCWPAADGWLAVSLPAPRRPRPVAGVARPRPRRPRRRPGAVGGRGRAAGRRSRSTEAAAAAARSWAWPSRVVADDGRLRAGDEQLAARGTPRPSALSTCAPQCGDAGRPRARWRASGWSTCRRCGPGPPAPACSPGRGREVVKVESTTRPDGARLGNRDFYERLHAGQRSARCLRDRRRGDAELRRARGRGRRRHRGLATPRPRPAGHRPRRGRGRPGPARCGSRSPPTAAPARGATGWASATTAPPPAAWWPGPPTAARRFVADAVADPLTGMVAAALVARARAATAAGWCSTWRCARWPGRRPSAPARRGDRRPPRARWSCCRSVEVEGRVRRRAASTDGVVAAVGTDLAPPGEVEVVDGAGERCCPACTTTTSTSWPWPPGQAGLDLDPLADAAAVDAALAPPPRTPGAQGAEARAGWLRVAGYDEHRHGPMDRRRLDAAGARACRAGAAPQRPGVGALHRRARPGRASLDDAGRAAADRPDGVELDADGGPRAGCTASTGGWGSGSRTWRRTSPAVGRYAGAPAGSPGSPTPPSPSGPDGRPCSGGARRSGVLLQRLVLLGVDDADAADLEGWAVRRAGQAAGRRGPRPRPDGAWPMPSPPTTPRGRAVAIHAVTRAENVAAVAALVRGRPAARATASSTGRCCPPTSIPLLAAAGVTVVVQPSLVAERGDHHLVAGRRRRPPLPPPPRLVAGRRRAGGRRQRRAGDRGRPVGRHRRRLHPAHPERRRRRARRGRRARAPPSAGTWPTRSTPAARPARRARCRRPTCACSTRPLAEVLADPVAERVRATVGGGQAGAPMTPILTPDRGALARGRRARRHRRRRPGRPPAAGGRRRRRPAIGSAAVARSVAALLRETPGGRWSGWPPGRRPARRRRRPASGSTCCCARGPGPVPRPVGRPAPTGSTPSSTGSRRRASASPGAAVALAQLLRVGEPLGGGRRGRRRVVGLQPAPGGARTTAAGWRPRADRPRRPRPDRPVVARRPPRTDGWRSPSTGPRSATPTAPGSATSWWRPCRWPRPTTPSPPSSCGATGPPSAAAATSTSSAPPATRRPPTSCAPPATPASTSAGWPTGCTPSCTGRASAPASSSPPSPVTSTARSDATFLLPEVAMGLVPGAGGTACMPRRIGRHRAAHLALVGSTHRRRPSPSTGAWSTPSTTPRSRRRPAAGPPT